MDDITSLSHQMSTFVYNIMGVMQLITWLRLEQLTLTTNQKLQMGGIAMQQVGLMAQLFNQKYSTQDKHTSSKQGTMVVTSLFSTMHFLNRSGTGYFGRRFGSFLAVLKSTYFSHMNTSSAECYQCMQQ